MSEWMFLTNHAMVLSYVSRHPRTTALDLATSIGITERATRKILADLEAEGYITKKREGRRNRYGVDPDLSLRHPIHDEAVVGDLLQVFGWKRRGKSSKPAQ